MRSRPLRHCSFGGETLPWKDIENGSIFADGRVDRFFTANSPDVRRPEVFACAHALRARYKRVGIVGYCYGGWSSIELGAAEHKGRVDCISTGHPTSLTEETIAAVGVPVQILAPEHDPMFTPALKEYANKVIPTLGVPYDYQYFPGVIHGFCIRGNRNDPKERHALERAKNSAVLWCLQFLHPSQ